LDAADDHAGGGQRLQPVACARGDERSRRRGDRSGENKFAAALIGPDATQKHGATQWSGRTSQARRFSDRFYLKTSTGNRSRHFLLRLVSPVWSVTPPHPAPTGSGGREPAAPQ